MLKFFFSIIIFVLIFSLNLEAKEDKTIQIIAKQVVTKGNIVTAIGDILIFSPSYYITAQKAIYDKNASTLELFDNVNISKNKEAISLSNYAFIDMNKETNSISPVLLIDKKSNIWINAQEVQVKSDLNILKDATLSSCKCYDPAWSIEFSSGDYNKTAQWVNLYNNTLYIKDIPAWYFLIPAVPYIAAPHLIAAYLIVNPPYFAFSTNKERRSGLLRPTLGYGENDGYLYSQPIYYAPSDDLDFEYIPQIRTHRGNGHEVNLRYKDSINSQLNMTIGIFNEKDSYYEKVNLINQQHYGASLSYNKTYLFAKNGHNDGLSISLIDMNDAEYMNTKHKQNIAYINQLVESNIKYYYNTNSFYGDIETKYYNDITKENNAEVMQILPQVQLHKYSYSFLFDKLLYSVDIKYSRKVKVEGLGASTTNINVPFVYSTHFFDKLIGFSFNEQISFTNIDYLNSETYKQGNYLDTKHIVSLYIDLIKPYTSFIHSINYSLTYTKPHKISSSGDVFGVNNSDTSLKLFPVSSSQENLSFSVNQILYNKENTSAIISHKIKQSVVYDENKNAKFDDLENELTFYFPYGSLSNSLIYSHEDNLLKKSTYALRLSRNGFFTNVDYSYSKTSNDADELKSITGHIGTKVLKYYTVSYKEQYNITDKVKNIKEYELIIDKKCWSLGIKLADNLVATSTTDQKARRQNIFYTTISLKPIVTYKHVYTQKEREINE